MMFLILLQTVAPQTPDLELNAAVRARSITIERRGNAGLSLTAEPDGGTLVEVEAPDANGRKTLRNVEVTVRAEARIAAPPSLQILPDQPETSPPDDR